jgi:hypothetical protein
LAQLLRRKTPSQRAVIAAEIIDGRLVIVGLTAKSVTTLCGANTNYVAAALKCTPEQRAAVAAGDRPLIQPQSRARAAAAINWGTVDDDTLIEAIRRIGLERTIEAAVAVERAS